MFSNAFSPYYLHVWPAGYPAGFPAAQQVKKPTPFCIADILSVDMAEAARAAAQAVEHPRPGARPRQAAHSPGAAPEARPAPPVRSADLKFGVDRILSTEFGGSREKVTGLTALAAAVAQSQPARGGLCYGASRQLQPGVPAASHPGYPPYFPAAPGADVLPGRRTQKNPACGRWSNRLHTDLYYPGFCDPQDTLAYAPSHDFPPDHSQPSSVLGWEWPGIYPILPPVRSSDRILAEYNFPDLSKISVAADDFKRLRRESSILEARTFPHVAYNGGNCLVESRVDLCIDLVQSETQVTPRSFPGSLQPPPDHYRLGGPVSLRRPLTVVTKLQLLSFPCGFVRESASCFGPYAILNAESQQNSQPKRKRTWSRAVFSNLQRKGLEKRFDIQKYVTKPDRKQLASMLGLTDAQFSRHARSHRQSHGHGRPLKPPSDNQPQTRFTQQYKTPNQHDSERGLKTMRKGLVPEPADEVEKRHEGEGAAGAGEECLDDDEDSPDTSVEHVNPDCAASGAGKTEQTTSHPELNGPADVPYGQ
ncbi:hypothetical protein Bbelb_440940 [Branchiostoma belcheri]|nr:hypothetical protein Bbelb_440940 [Branchiostoma belcheri]